MSNKQIYFNNFIDRRQFIRKSVIGLLGVGAGAVFVGCKIPFVSPHKELRDYHLDLPNQEPTIPLYSNKVLYLNEHQYALVATLAALIIPTDDDPGATEAGVVDYIDNIVASSEKKQTLYTKGLKWLDDFSQERYGAGKDFLNLSLRKQIDLLGSIYEMPSIHHRQVSSFFQRVSRKINSIWDDLFGIGKNLNFFLAIRQDVLDGYYSNPISWKGVGYFGPPNPVGYPDFSNPPSSKHYSDSVRFIDNATCNTCHEKGEHPRGGLIDQTCIACHRPHSPWPYDKEAFYLEDHIGVVFSNPDRKKGNN